MVKMIPMICPKCGASLEVKDGTTQCFCTYCGTKILIKDDSVKTININKTEYDKTKVEMMKLKTELEKERQKSKRRSILYDNLGALFILLFLLISAIVGTYLGW